MLDKLSLRILEILNGISDGAYKIIDAADIISGLDGQARVSKLELVGIMRSLVDHELIAVKYSTMDEYCFATLPKARLVEEKERARGQSANETADKPIAEDGVEYDDSDGEDEKLRRQIVDAGEWKNAVDYKRIRRVVKYSALYGGFLGSLIGGLICIVVLLFLKK